MLASSASRSHVQPLLLWRVLFRSSLASMQVVVSGTVAAGAVSALAIGAAVVAALGTAASSGGGGGGGADPGAGNAVR